MRNKPTGDWWQPKPEDRVRLARIIAAEIAGLDLVPSPNEERLLVDDGGGYYRMLVAGQWEQITEEELLALMDSIMEITMPRVEDALREIARTLGWE